MADVTVNIRGDASQLRDELDNVSINPSSGGSTPPPSGRGSGSAVPSNDRMIEDVRREMQQRGVLLVPGSSSMTQIINQYGQATRGTVNDRISERYDARRDDMRSRMTADYDSVDKEIERKRQEGISRLGSRANDPLYRTALDDQLEQERERQYRRVGSQYDQEEEQINQEEESERAQSEAELTAAIRELTEYFNRRSEQGTPIDDDSYIGKLRAQQRDLIRQRDSADSEEGAMSASRELGDVNEKLRRVLGGGNAQQGVGLSSLQKGAGALGVVNSLQNGDIGGSLVGAAVMTGNPYAIGAAVAAAAGEKIVKNLSGVYESAGSLASFRSTAEGRRGADASAYMTGYIPNYGLSGYGNGIKTVADFGFDTDEFAIEASKRTRARGTGDNWFAETLRQVGLERNLAMDEGSLMEGSKFDKYGQTVTDAVSRMVTVLNGINGSGVNFGDFTRVQEKYDIQQSIMQSYMGRTDKPNYDVANKSLAAFSSIQGITQDSRLGNDFQQFQGMIQNPMNERMRALIYSSVADLMPELKDEHGNNYSAEDGGRMDLIDKALINPENEGKIMQAVVKRIDAMFGGADTQMGYFARKALLPMISPDRRDAEWDAVANGQAGSMLSNGINNKAGYDLAGSQNKDIWAKESTEFKTAWTKGISELINTINYWGGQAFGTAASKNQLKTGGGK